MSAPRAGQCSEPGPRDLHCTEDTLHRYSHYDAAEDVSWNDPEDWLSPHRCADETCTAEAPIGQTP